MCLVQELDEDNVLAYYQNLQTKAVSVVKSKEGRRKRLQEVIIEEEINLYLISLFFIQGFC